MSKKTQRKRAHRQRNQKNNHKTYKEVRSDNNHSSSANTHFSLFSQVSARARGLIGFGAVFKSLVGFVAGQVMPWEFSDKSDLCSSFNAYCKDGSVRNASNPEQSAEYMRNLEAYSSRKKPSLLSYSNLASCLDDDKLKSFVQELLENVGIGGKQSCFAEKKTGRILAEFQIEGLDADVCEHVRGIWAKYVEQCGDHLFGLTPGAIAGIVIGCIVAAVVGAGAYYLYKSDMVCSKDQPSSKPSALSTSV